VIVTVIVTVQAESRFRGNFIWVHLGGKLGFSDAISEKKVFQKLLDGGVYIVSRTLDIEHPASSIEHRAPSVEHRASGIPTFLVLV
jgi:hypothetical protein